MTETNESKEGKSKKGLIIGFIVILLAINTVQFFMNLNKTETIQSQEATIKTQETDISGMMVKLDSVETELTQKRQEIIRLGGKVTELDALLAEVQKDKVKLQKEKNLAVANIDKYKDRIEALTVQLNNSDKRIAHLTAQRDSLFKFNQTLEKKIEETTDTIKLLAYNKKELEEKVAVAAALKAENLSVDALTDRGKLKEGPDLKARHIHKLRVSFNFLKNDLTTIEGKDIYLRIIEPDGSTLFNSSLGGGMFMHEEKEIPFTLKQNILVENSGNQRIAFYFLKGSSFKTGMHTAEVYSEGFKIGEKKFLIE